MGGVIVEGGKTPFETAFTGGKPNPAWTQLVNQAVPNSPNQLRSVGSRYTTAYNLRRAGLATKFKKGDAIRFLLPSSTTLRLMPGWILSPTDSIPRTLRKLSVL